MAPKRGRGVAGRSRGRRGRGGRTPRSSRGGRHGATLVLSSSSSTEEGFWSYDFLLRVLNRDVAQIPLPFSSASIASERKLEGFWLRLHGTSRSSSWVELEVDASSLIFLGSGWRTFSRRLNLRSGDSICCRFDGEHTVIIRAFDAGGNRLDPYCEETSSSDSEGLSGGSPASPVSSPSADPSGDGVCSSSSKEELDVKPVVKRQRQYARHLVELKDNELLLHGLGCYFVCGDARQVVVRKCQLSQHEHTCRS